MNQRKKMISIVIPILNEQENIALLNAEIRTALISLMRRFDAEIIYVNDGSTDGSLVEMRKLRGVKIINLTHRYGQGSALDAGFKAAQGEIVVSIDGDGQNDPNDIPALVEKMEDDGLDVVVGWRRDRKDRFSIRLISNIGMIMRRSIFRDAIHDTGCTLRVYTKEAVGALNIYGTMHRFIVFILAQKGFCIGEITVNHRRRIHGSSKYAATKFIRASIDFLYIWYIYKFRHRDPDRSRFAQPYAISSIEDIS
jgi:glycosyltransferase involved in cell wall biosynthesis